MVEKSDLRNSPEGQSLWNPLYLQIKLPFTIVAIPFYQLQLAKLTVGYFGQFVQGIWAQFTVCLTHTLAIANQGGVYTLIQLPAKYGLSGGLAVQILF